MLFHVNRQFTDTPESDGRVTGDDGSVRSLAVFSQWQPPAGGLASP